MARILLACCVLATTMAAAQLTPEHLKAIRERANLPAPAIAATEFDGRYETKMSERIGMPGPLITVALECARGACTFSMGDMRESYTKPGTVRLGLFERTQSQIAQLHPGAKVRGCINLGGDAMPDGPFACRLERDLDGKRVVLLVPPGGDGIMTLSATK